ncbi:hypothetical protein ACO0LF_03680 [Undibacterium sp. Di27W]|uniref:hypothetical protein n=1 Tax=Undibacterium sp. Di27W TaxID=3413036 RepID=UPI003BF02174
MTDRTYLTRKEFAERQGFSPAYVSKLGKSGRLVLSADGKMVDVQATADLLKRSADPSKVAVAQRHERDRVERDVRQFTKPNAPDIPEAPFIPPAPNDDQDNFQKARAKREHYLSLQAENEYLKQIGQLVERDKVEAAAFKLARLQRDVMMGLPTKVAPILSAMTDSWEIEKAMRESIRKALADLAIMAEQDLQTSMD